MLVPIWALCGLAFMSGMGFCAFLFLLFGVSRARVRTEVANDLVGLLALMKQPPLDVPLEPVKE